MLIALAFLPSLIWGTTNLLTPWVGGSLRQQLGGMAVGAAAMAAIVTIALRPAMGGFGVAFTSGMLIAAGLYYILWAFKALGVSRALPLTTGIQLVGLAVFGVVVYGEWTTTGARLVGGLALAIITAGTAAISWEDRGKQTRRGRGERAATPLGKADATSPGERSSDSRSERAAGRAPFGAGIISVLVASACFIAYPAIMRLADVSGAGTFLPQALGLLCGTALLLVCDPAPLALTVGRRRYSVATTTQPDLASPPPQWRRDIGSREFRWFMLLGALWMGGVAQLVWNNENIGVATAFPLSQLGVVISTVGALYWLKEPKTAAERRAIFVGVCALVVGTVLIGAARSLS